MEKVNEGLEEMNINADGDCFISLNDLNNIEFLPSAPPIEQAPLILQFHVIGDTKGGFQLAGRSGYDSCYCLYSMCKPKQ